MWDITSIGGGCVWFRKWVRILGLQLLYLSFFVVNFHLVVILKWVEILNLNCCIYLSLLLIFIFIIMILLCLSTEALLEHTHTIKSHWTKSSWNKKMLCFDMYTLLQNDEFIDFVTSVTSNLPWKFVIVPICCRNLYNHDDT